MDTGRVENPASQSRNKPGVLGHGNKLSGGQQAFFQMPPANQGFQTGQLIVMGQKADLFLLGFLFGDKARLLQVLVGAEGKLPGQGV